MRKEWSKVFSMLVAMKTEDSLRTGAIMVVAKNLAWHTAQSIIYGREQKVCELGIINSPEFISQITALEKGLCMQLTLCGKGLWEVWWEVTT